MRSLLLTAVLSALLLSCQQSATVAGTAVDSTGTTMPSLANYFDYGDSGVQAGGVKMIPINTPRGTFPVWTKRIGNNPRVKVLLLHGGPAMGHEYLEVFQSFFPKEGFEFWEYDQLGCANSELPPGKADSSLWTVDRFVDEVEQVRRAIGADSTNFIVLGHSWGGILGMEYALKYQQHMKGLIVSNMMASCPEYGRYADSVLARGMDPKVVAEIRALEKAGKYTDPRYEELLIPNFYAKHLCRLPEWPEPMMRTLKHMNKEIYVLMQGPSEFGISGRLALWDREADLKNLRIPTLMIGGTYDTMDPKAMEEQSKLVQKGEYLHCPNGSHMAMWDDQKVYMEGVVRWIRKVDGGK